MKLFEQLKVEINTPKSGVYAPYFYRYSGIKENITKSNSLLRANGIYSLFANSKPHIYKADLIVGNTKSLLVEENATLLNHYSNMCASLWGRDFPRNADHFAPDYQKILSVGITGLKAEIQASLVKHSSDASKVDFLKAMNLTLDGFACMIANYGEKAAELKENTEYNKERLDFIVKNTADLVTGPPKSFAQALQLIWFAHTAFMMEGRGAMALGRLDQYLYPFYKNDIENGVISDDKVLELLENTFIKIPAGDVVNICIGGMDKDGNCQINELSYLILKAVGNCNVPGPNLSARITPNTPDNFLDECLKTIGTGLGYPALMNDTINIAALKKFGYEEDDVYNYSMVGCIENFITGMQPPWTDGRFDAPRFFDYIFNNGTSEFNKSFGLDLGDVDQIKSMDKFMNCFEAQLKNGANEYFFNFMNYNNMLNPKQFTEPFLSCFCHDCIGRGLDINDGGAKYPSVHGVALMGVGTISDSLAAIEKVIFIDKEATLYDLKEAINNNFEGYEDLRNKLLAAPKYGNNDNFADKYAVWFLDYLHEIFDKFKTRDGGGFYCAMAANISNIHAGNVISATPDGRLKGEPLSDAASPTYGRDSKGCTVTLTSVAKPDYTKAACGSVVNQKFLPTVFEENNRDKLLALVKTYFKKGGQEIQINATSPQILRDAMDHPEKYRDLVVRVSGFSAYYVTLAKSVQLDILARTQQELR
ncbi:MAG: hypothetical protein E7385_06305 [Ruminococcaceae bacterium]|nr:hypothetical protein [Oscillospiraceae bacterium]